MLLFSGGPEAGDAAEQAGGGDLLTVRRWCQRGGYEDGNKVLLCPVLLENMESHCLHFLWSCSSFLQPLVESRSIRLIDYLSLVDKVSIVVFNWY